MHPLPVRPLGSQTSLLPRTGMNCSFSSFVCMKFPPRLPNKWMGTFLEFLKSEDLKGYFARVEIHCSTTCGNSWWVAGEGGWVDFLSNNVRWINLLLWLDNSSISSWISSSSALQGVLRSSRQVPVEKISFAQGAQRCCLAMGYPFRWFVPSPWDPLPRLGSLLNELDNPHEKRLVSVEFPPSWSRHQIMSHRHES